MRDIVKETKARQLADGYRYVALDRERCQLCDAQGPDKRSLWLDCFYAVEEVVPEAIDLTALEPEALGGRAAKGYYLLICKSCRARLLAHLAAWREDGVALRELPKDSDGELIGNDEPGRDIPVRIHGMTVLLTDVEYQAYCQARGITYHLPVRVRPEPPPT